MRSNYRGHRQAKGKVNEIGASICQRPNGSFVFGPFAEGDPMSVQVPLSCPQGSEWYGIFHTHPAGVPIPSPTDIRSGLKTGAKVLCINADGHTECWDPR